MFLAVGAVAVYYGVAVLGIWERIAPRGGLMPAIAGGFLVILCALKLFDKHERNEKFKLLSNMWIPPLAVVAVWIMTHIVGMLPAIALMVLGWLIIVEKYSFWRSTQITLVIFLCTYGIFRLWLRVFFPTGLLGNLF